MIGPGDPEYSGGVVESDTITGGTWRRLVCVFFGHEWAPWRTAPRTSAMAGGQVVFLGEGGTPHIQIRDHQARLCRSCEALQAVRKMHRSKLGPLTTRKAGNGKA